MRYILMAISVTEDLNRFQVPIAALNLLARHASQWRLLLAENYQPIYTSIVANCKHGNYDIKAAAYLALESFLREVNILCGFFFLF